ncbi:MAG TPA: helix-turn-helix transcriptional regulator [Rhizobiales bacterium]|nr:helix-turn-helix transcriptional regulator [Hyphomicrobiales bacterium]
MRAATEAFAEMGYRSVTMSHIATRARIGRATLYLHFSSKAEIADEIALTLRPHMVAVVMTLPDIEFGLEGLERWIASIVTEQRKFSRIAAVANEALVHNRDLADIMVGSMQDTARQIAAALRAQGRWPEALGEGGLAMLLTGTMQLATTVFGASPRPEDATLTADLARLWHVALAHKDDNEPPVGVGVEQP